uniref:Calcium-regulated actin-bundling protein C-terminal domain-containing protein n=1 Tax=Entamoeba invadens TaxID=33085 RepID=S0AYS1_ENTIV|nr:hypothetical protein [Entamoeba invadens]
MSLTDAEKTKLQQISSKKYKEQAIWFLNAYWAENGEAVAEKVWDVCNKFAEFDQENKAEGCSLDEMNIHRILEFYQSQQTIQQFRESLRSQQFEVKKLYALGVYLSWNYKLTLKKFVNAPQGAQSAEMAKAQEMVDQVGKLLEEANAKATEATKKDKELETALNALKKEETDFNNKTEELKQRIEKETGVVKKNRAQAELAQHLESDPLPLRKAKITCEAAKKKSEKVRKEAEDAAEEMRKKMEEAEAYLNEQKAAASAGMGLMWWMQRELTEKKKYMPTRKGGVAKK